MKRLFLNDYLATRGKLTKQEIDAKIARKEFWMSGKEAVELGFADEFIKSTTDRL